jgi:hypothetical protein
MIFPCTCTHSAQDYFHGKGRRVHNLCKHETAARCTVCKNEKSLGKEQIKDAKEKVKK